MYAGAQRYYCMLALLFWRHRMQAYRKNFTRAMQHLHQCRQVRLCSLPSLASLASPSASLPPRRHYLTSTHLFCAPQCMPAIDTRFLLYGRPAIAPPTPYPPFFPSPHEGLGRQEGAVVQQGMSRLSDRRKKQAWKPKWGAVLHDVLAGCPSA